MVNHNYLLFLETQGRAPLLFCTEFVTAVDDGVLTATGLTGVVTGVSYESQDYISNMFITTQLQIVKAFLILTIAFD